MSDVMAAIVLYALYAATVAFLFAMLFIRDWRRWWLRLATVAVGCAAAAYPVFVARTTLGYPDPWPEDGHYEMLGWQIDEPERAIYMFLVNPDGAEPLHYRVPFDLRTAIALQDAAAQMGIYRERAVILRRDPETGEIGYELAFAKRFPDDAEIEIGQEAR